MLKKINIIIAMVLINMANLYSQTIGFQGCKNIVSGEFLVNVPIFSGSFNKFTFREKNGAMEQSKEWINTGYSFNYLRQLKSGFAMGIEFLNKQTIINAPISYASYSSNASGSVFPDSSYLRMEGIGIRSKSYMLRMEFSNANGIAPAGIIHSLGLGFTQANIQNKPYRYAVNEFGPGPENAAYWTAPDNYFISKDYPSINGITISYGCFYRRPVSKHLTVDLGIKYLFSFYSSMSDQKLEVLNGHPLDYSSIYYRLKRENLMSISLKAGLTYLF
ncbi:MAG: hypothetical protein WC044_03545 [Crocinitomicaceae bacterium]